MGKTSSELKRVEILRLHDILDSPNEPAFDHITKAAAEACETPIALIRFIDDSRQWIKSCVGLEVGETPRDIAFCAQAMKQSGALMEVSDATKDNRFASNPLVIGEPNIRFYAGMPLTTSDGFALGTLSVIDRCPRNLTSVQRSTLRHLGCAISGLLADRRRMGASPIAISVDPASRTGILVTDIRLPHHPIAYVNSGFEKLTGYSKDDVIGRNCRFLQGVETDETVVLQIRQAIAENRECQVTIRNYRKDGSAFWNDLVVSPVRNSAGHVTHFLGVLSDVTDRYLAEQKLVESHALLGKRELDGSSWLYESEERYRDLFEKATALIQCVRLDGTFLDVNPAWHSTLGYGDKDLETLSFFDIVHPEHRSDCERLLAKVLRGGAVDSMETVLVASSGDVVHVEGNVSWHKENEEDRFCLILHDITTRVVAAAKLQQAKEAAEQTAEEQARFLTAASHDLRQPVTAIELYLAILAKKIVDPTDKMVCREIKQLLTATGDLLSSLLDISRLKSGTLCPEVVTFSPRALFEKLRAANEPHATKKGIELGFAIEAGCSIDSDPTLLLRILDNLVTNAIRYTDEGRVDVRFHCVGGVGQIEVVDTGIGIAEEHLDDIFDHYVQVNKAMPGSRNGLGLGLAIVNHIAKILGCRVEASSALGAGSRFVIEVPIADAIEESRGVAVTPARRELEILVVDDNPEVLWALKMLLKLSGNRVHAAKDGQEALSLVRNGVVPQVLVVDYRLPGLNGMEVIERIRRTLAVNLPAVLLSGDTSLADSQSTAANCVIMSKPICEEALLSLLQELTDGDRVQSSEVAVDH